MPDTPLPWVRDDGGRAAAGFKGDTGDCVTRAVAIATGRAYRDVYDMFHAAGNKVGKRSAARTGVPYAAINAILSEQLGWQWRAVPRDSHLTVEEMPSAPVFIADLKRAHFVAVIDGAVHDTWDATSRFPNVGMERVACLWMPPADFVHPGQAKSTDLCLPEIDDLSTVTLKQAQIIDHSLRGQAKALAHNMVAFKALIARARVGSIHTLLGFESWTAYVADVVGKEMGRLHADDRHRLVEVLSGEGMSNRGIAEVVGVNEITVRRDLEDVRQNVAPDPKPVTGRDGKTYTPPRKPRKPRKKREPKPVTWERARDLAATLSKQISELVKSGGGDVDWAVVGATLTHLNEARASVTDMLTADDDEDGVA